MSVASNFERQMLDLINAERTSRGLDPVALELRLNASSEDHSTWMLDRDVFSHTGSGGSSAGDRMRDAGFQFSGSWTWGENIAWQSERGAPGIADDVADLHRGLMNSPGHRANILNPDFEVIGLGIEVGNFEGYEAVMVTQNFARTSAPVQLDTGSVSNTPPVAKLAARDFDAGKWLNIGTKIKYEDADGDPAVQFEVRNPTDDFTLRHNGRVVDASDGYRFDAADMATLRVTGGEPGLKQVLQVRGFDGEDWGAWDNFRLRTNPDQTNTAPRVSATDITLTDVPGQHVAGLHKYVSVRDADGDKPVWYEIQDRDGEDNFRFLGQGRLDAFEPYRVAARDLDRIRVDVDSEPGQSEIRIRAYDGEDVGPWSTVTITTLPAEDAFSFV